MSQRIKRQAQMLKFLSRAKPNVVKAVVNNCEKELLDAVCECSLNVLKGTVPLKKRERKCLEKYKNHLRALTDKGISRRKKKAVLQKGGFLQALLTPILTVLGNILT